MGLRYDPEFWFLLGFTFVYQGSHQLTHDTKPSIWTSLATASQPDHWIRVTG